jgi:TPR repeat protein
VLDPGLLALLAWLGGRWRNYATALRHLRPLADQGDARAQFKLTLVYAEGQGVQQN